MKGLLLKDILNLKQQGRIYILIILIWTGIAVGNGDHSFFIGAMTVFSVLIPLSAIAYDERANWERYALAMPITRRDLVFSRYLLSWTAASIGSLLAAGIARWLGRSATEGLVAGVTSFTTGLFMSSIILPIILKLGVEKGRLVMIVIFLLPWMLVMVLPQLGIGLDLSGLNVDLLSFIIPLVALVLAWISLNISVHIYRSKEF